MLAKRIFVILLCLSLLSCTQNISNPTETDFSGTEIYGDLIILKLNDGTSDQMEVDFLNKKGIYGSGKGYNWENIQKITIEEKKDVSSNNSGNGTMYILLSPFILVGGLFALIYGGITCSLSDCTK